MLERKALRGLPLVGAAGVGVLAAHALTYKVVVPDAGRRAALLAETGHSYWPAAVEVSALALVVVLATVAIRQLRPTAETDTSAAGVLRWMAARLIVLQGLGFTTLEVIERASSGIPVSHMFRNDLFAIGLLMQIVLACIVAVALLAFCRVAARAARASQSFVQDPRGPVAALPLRTRPLMGPVALTGAEGVRGPPAG